MGTSAHQPLLDQSQPSVGVCDQQPANSSSASLAHHASVCWDKKHGHKNPGTLGTGHRVRRTLSASRGSQLTTVCRENILREKILQAVYSRDGDAAAVLPAARRGPEAHRLVVRREHALYPHRLVRVLRSVTVMSRVTCPGATCPPA